ncbi:MAG: PPOX class F420-dependent oxidoreductase [Chloroflexi bacterium]|nr:PPOX class F420-dependent oxidoreductase [Chloroflexota bacterium]
MPPMTREQADAFLRESRAHAVVATINKDGSPQLTPVWYHWDGKTLTFALQERTLKLRNLQRDPRLTVMVHAEPNGDRYVVLRGRATIHREDVQGWRRRIWGRYVGRKTIEKWLPQLSRPDQPMAVVRMVPEKVVGLDLPTMVELFAGGGPEG